MKQFYLFCILLSVFFLKAQNSDRISGYTLWLKTINSKDSLMRKIKDPNEISRTHFNFNQIVDRQSISKSYKNIVSEQYSLFVVFKSDFEEKRSVLTVSRGKTKVQISNKDLINDKEMLYKIDAKQGIILSYINGNNDKNGKKRNSLILDDLFGIDIEGKEQLIELIYFPRFISKLERQRIETWLSIKYGISISGEFDYLDSKGDKIWEAKKNSLYNNRVTGIGRDDTYGLYQKQSGNYQKDGVYVGLGIIDTTNLQNKSVLKDKAFLLWGDNAGKTTLTDHKETKLKKMGRIWKMDISGITPQDSIITQLKLNKKEIAYTNKAPGQEFLWLCVNAIENSKFNYTTAKYYRQSSEDNDFIYFNDISWDSDGNGADTFTFTQGPDFSMEHTSDFICESGNGIISVKLVGGTPPYTLNLDGKELTTTENHVEFSELSSGNYSLQGTESKGKTDTAMISVDPFSNIQISLESVWYIGVSGETVVMPVITKTNAGLSFEWIKDDKILSVDKEFTSKTPGDYILRIKTNEGCIKAIPFKIENGIENLSSRWTIYPNPTKSGEPFSIAFNLEKETEVILNINSIEGKQVLHKNLGLIKDFVYRDAMVTSGVYLITLYIGNTTETVKLIVH